MSTGRSAEPVLLELEPGGRVDLDAADCSPAIGFHTSGRRLPLLIVHSWAREAGHLQQLARHLGTDQPIYGISPPSGEWPVDFPRTVEAWSCFCLTTLRLLRRHGPYVLGGWSFGGVIALTMAEQLAATGEDVRRVVMVDSRLPTKRPRNQRNWVRKCLHHLDEALGMKRGERLAYLRTIGERRWERDRPHWLRFRGHGAPLERKTPEVVRSHPLLRAIHTAYLRYEPVATTLPVSLFWTSESHEHMGDDLTLGWGPYLRGAFESQAMPGTHVSLFDPPHVECLADALRSTLDRLDRPATTPG